VADRRQAIDPQLLVAAFDYDLPSELIAQSPLEDRNASRLLVVDRRSGVISHSTIRELGRWLAPGDLLVANNSRVLPARLRGVRADTGGRAELLLLRRDGAGRWSALAMPARRLHKGTRITLIPRDNAGGEPGLATIVERRHEGEVLVQLDEATEAGLERFGTVPLPPYITTVLDDDERYQTVYASPLGSAAAPTAGLHFTEVLIHDLRTSGIGWVEVTLHVGLDTFRPVTVNRVVDHVIHREWCSVSDDAARAVAETKRAGGRVVAVGTTAARTLETLGRHWQIEAPAGLTCLTDLFITPGYEWQVVDAMLTNFHLPKSTLLMMVSSLAGDELTRRAYAAAVAERYRFFSFGDAMLIR
jgi:S-adenosylmethionine:tRNA ribosyltransferase-isomerase